LTLLGALIVVGGFALALLTNVSTGSFAPFSPTQHAPDLAFGPAGGARGIANYYSFGTSPAQPYPGSTQVIEATTTTESSSSYGGYSQGLVTSLNVTGGGTGGTGSLVEFSSDLSITSATPQATASAVVALAYTAGGYVAYQATYKSSAYIVIRVPAAQYQQTLSKVEGMGTVVSVVSNSNDVRVQYTDLNATLASLRTEQSALLNLLNKSTTVNSTLQIESTLQGVDQQINDVSSQILQTRTLVSYSTIDVTISESAQTTPLSIALKAAPENGTAPFSVTFNAVVKGGAQPYVVNYDFGDGSANQGQILIHTFYQAGDFQVTVTATDQNGTVAIATQKIRVNAPPTQLGVNDFFGNVANLFVNVVEGIVEVAVVVLPLAAVGAVILIPLRRRSKPQKDLKQDQ
ncbi:MAG TPA: DUF4349 domain-containing protein, partial [Nitrososphaerales archaeon]|nr:DUF4349 domain-containing protein [Nitrososphaerales archaeon]